MNELFFIGMDIVEETKRLCDFAAASCTDGMTDTELNAYQMGVKNTLSALQTMLCTDSADEYVININGMEIPTEFTIEDLQEYCV